jgi:hypothetical protein
MIVTCREYGDKHEFSDWQYDILNEMDNFLDSIELG